MGEREWIIIIITSKGFKEQRNVCNFVPHSMFHFLSLEEREIERFQAEEKSSV